MTALYLATAAGPLGVVRENGKWRANPANVGRAASIAADPDRPGRVYCGTDDRGVWRSDDAGATWRQAAGGPADAAVTSLLVSGVEKGEDGGVVYAGTGPSAVLRSEDGGATWRNCAGLDELPSAPEWSFPPRPETHHVRWIEADPHAPGRLYVAIEAGALIVSPDSGQSWRDRVPGGPYDTHQLVTHLQSPGRLRSAAGDGFFESDDSGGSWRRVEEGLRSRYCWSAAADASDPHILVVSASRGPLQAHVRDRAYSEIYRSIGGGPWQAVRAGLPPPEGTRAFAVASSPGEPGVFFAGADGALYRSEDAGATWSALEVAWPPAYAGKHVRIMAAARM